MTYISATGEYGLVVRRKALDEKQINAKTLFEVMEGVDILGEDGDLISFGPMFGEEALSELSQQLQIRGLENVEDFFAIDLMTPPWLKIGVSLS